MGISTAEPFANRAPGCSMDGLSIGGYRPCRNACAEATMGCSLEARMESCESSR